MLTLWATIFDSSLSYKLQKKNGCIHTSGRGCGAYSQRLQLVQGEAAEPRQQFCEADITDESSQPRDAYLDTQAW